MSISSHPGIVILVIIGIATVIGVIIIATIEDRRADREQTPAQPVAPQSPASRKKK
jgi:predicted MFS family arabinose efflux permease